MQATSIQKSLFIDVESNRATSMAHMWDVRVVHGSNQIDFNLRHNKFDLIMIDHDMPMMDGELVIRSFWGDFHQHDCPIIIHSANRDGALRMSKLLEEAGFDDIFVWCLPHVMEIESLFNRRVSEE